MARSSATHSAPKPPRQPQPVHQDGSAPPMPTVVRKAETDGFSERLFSQIPDHAHTAVMLAYLYQEFDSLVANPVLSLSTSLALLIGFQVVHSIIRMFPAPLPISGGGASESKRSSSASAIMAQKTLSGRDLVLPPLSSRINSSLVSLVATIIPGPILVSLILILFGAQFSSSLLETILCAAHLSMLIIYPLLYTYGFSSDTWTSIVSFQQPMNAGLGSAVGAIVGAWAGAIPIPLDWDRPWQRWPVTIVVGAYLGFAVGRFLGGTVLQGKTHFALTPSS